jgi:hypothetical protein
MTAVKQSRTNVLQRSVFTTGNSLKYRYYEREILPILQTHTFREKKFRIEIEPARGLKEFFLHRGGHYSIIKIYHKESLFATIGIKLYAPEPNVFIKTVWVGLHGEFRTMMKSVNKFRPEDNQVPLNIRIDAREKQKVFLNPIAVPKIVQSFINESEKWRKTLNSFMRKSTL